MSGVRGAGGKVLVQTSTRRGNDKVMLQMCQVNLSKGGGVSTIKKQVQTQRAMILQWGCVRGCRAQKKVQVQTSNRRGNDKVKFQVCKVNLSQGAGCQQQNTSANTKGNDPMVGLCQGVRGAEKKHKCKQRTG